MPKRLAATLFLAVLVSAPLHAQKKPPPPPLVINTTFAALDQSLWGKGEWFSVPDYHALGEQPYDQVMIRRRYNEKAGTWLSGLEVAVVARGAGMVQVKIRLTVVNPKGSHDKDVTALMEIMQGDKIIQKANLKMDVESKEEKSKEAVFMLPMDLFTAQPALSLRLTMRTENS